MVEKWQEFYTPIGLVRYISVFTPMAGKPFRPGDAPPPPRYSVEIIIDPKQIAQNPKEQKNFEDLKRYCAELGMDLFPPQKSPDGRVIPGTGYAERVKLKTCKWPFRDSLERAGKPGYDEGTQFFRATLDGTQTPPAVVGPDLRPLEERDVYPGCYGRAKVTAIAYDQGGGQGVKLMLRGFQKARDGAPIVGTSQPATFEEIESDFMQDQTEPETSAFGGLV